MVDIVRTKDYLLNNVFQDGQPDGSITPQDIRDLVVTVPYLQTTGWKFYLDGQYTQGSPRTILAGQRTQVTIDGLAENSSHPPGTPDCWNFATNRLISPGLNAFGLIRFAVTGTHVGNQPSLLDFELDAGGTAGVIFRETAVFSRGTGFNQSFNFVMPLFCGPDFVANGGVLYLTPEVTGTYWEFAVTAINLYMPNPAL